MFRLREELGIIEVISKPFELTDLLTAVRRACGEHAMREQDSLIR